jgi:hypothetical protein
MSIQALKQQAVNCSARILRHYFADACPCRFPRFVYWVTKEHVKATDPTQNCLILVCRHLPADNLVAAVDMADSESGGWTCSACGSLWLDLCEEKSNLNYAHRFVLREDLRRGSLVDQHVPSAILTASDFSNMQEWEHFMIGNSESPNKAFQRTLEDPRR